jgi:ADP-ribose pyrophosphatase YjhB (NUDIX family)
MGIIIQQTAAGGLVVRVNEFGYQVLLALVRREEPNDWSLPKGRIEEGESRQQAAQRIVKEQTGVDTAIIASLGPVDYSYTIFLPVDEQDSEGNSVASNPDIQQAMQSYHKVVYFYLMNTTGGTLGEGEEAADEVQWFTIPEAQELLTHEGDLTTLARAVDLITRQSQHGQILIGSGFVGNSQGNVNPETAHATTVRSKLWVLSFEFCALSWQAASSLNLKLITHNSLLISPHSSCMTMQKSTLKQAMAGVARPAFAARSRCHLAGQTAAMGDAAAVYICVPPTI